MLQGFLYVQSKWLLYVINSFERFNNILFICLIYFQNTINYEKITLSNFFLPV